MLPPSGSTLYYTFLESPVLQSPRETLETLTDLSDTPVARLVKKQNKTKHPETKRGPQSRYGSEGNGANSQTHRETDWEKKMQGGAVTI